MRVAALDHILPHTHAHAIDSPGVRVRIALAVPRLPSGDLKGYAFIEFDSAEAAADASIPGALDEEATKLLSSPSASVRVMHRRAWAAMKAAYKQALERGAQEAEAQSASDAAAAAVGAAFAAAAAKEAEQRNTVVVRGLSKGLAVKAVRAEMRTVFGEVAPCEFVDYGITNSGDVTMACIRMATPVGAAEAVRVLTQTARQLGPIRLVGCSLAHREGE